jgi:outer membrane protein assembly factor BamB
LSLRRSIVGPALAGLVLAFLPSTGAPATSCNWPMYGHDLGHSFAAAAGCTTISPLNVSTLRPRWFLNTHAPVTASPSVVDGVVYAGAHNGTFYAVNASNGKPRWTFHVTDTNSNDYGPIVSSAAVDTIDGTKIVLFGGGSTLYMLDAATGHELASSCFDPRPPPAVACRGSTQTIEIEASPAVVHTASGEVRVVAGMDFNEDPAVGRAGVIELRVDHAGGSWNLVPVWKFDPETLKTYTVDPLHAGGSGTGCGNVWSSPSVDVGNGLVFFGVGNCDKRPNPFEVGDGEAIVAISLDDGTLVWRFQPRPADNDLDLDYGSSAQLLPGGRMGEAGKDGTYYSFERVPGTAHPAPVWTSHVTIGSDIGGIIGSVALGAARGKPAIFAGSAIPVSSRVPKTSLQEAIRHPLRLTSLHAIDAATGKILWNAPVIMPSYAAITYANGVVFLPATFGFQMQAYHAGLGVPLWAFPLGAAPSSGAAIVGSAIYFGAGTTGAGLPISNVGGIWSFGLAAG